MPPIVIQRLIVDNLSLDGFNWSEGVWNSKVENPNPFQDHIRDKRLPLSDKPQPILGTSDKPFSGEHFYPLEKKKDINKMFRQHKKRGDENRFYTEESTGQWVLNMYNLLVEHGVIK